jgi:Skp family chaperone for outer membrane proteins
LARINRSLDDLDAKIDKSGDATKAEAKSKVAALREEVVHLGQQLDRVKNATETTWEGVKADSKNAYRKLSADVRRGRQWVSNKIAR